MAHTYPTIAASASSRDARSRTRSFAIVLSIFIVLAIVALVTSWAAIMLVNDTRAYTRSEGRYSKAEKMSVLDLYRYAHSGRDADYQAFLKDTKVTWGVHIALVALSATPIDQEAATRGFLQGESHPDDIPGMIRLFRLFSWWAPFAAAIEDWREGDRLDEQLIVEGARLHRLIASNQFDDRARAEALARIDAIDDAMTHQENMFSSHMSDAARLATRIVVWGLGALTIVLWTIGIAFSVRLLRRQLALDRQLAASERRFRDYAEIASDWYWEMDQDCRVSYLSDRLVDILSASLGGALGTSGTDIIRACAVDPVHRDECLRAIAERRPYRGLCLELTGDDGTKRYYAFSGKPNISPDGEHLGFRGVGTEITAQVTNAQVLQDAKERAEVANRTKSEFLANMSHELRTPLNAILGFSDIIRDRMFGGDAMDKYSGYARDIHSSGSHLLSIINDILDLSKIEAGQASIEECEVDLAVLVDEARTLLADHIRQAPVSLDIALPEPTPHVLVDERKIVQILVNLLSNAFKFTPAGGRITLSAASTEDGGITVTVRDTGIGIAPEDLETVLSPFGQVESAFSRKHHGTGLGLPLAKSLAELHGGALTIESRLHEGTAVSIYLPPHRVVAKARRAAYRQAR